MAGLVNMEGNSITWFMPGGRQRAYEIERVLPARRGVAFAFVDREGRTFELRPLTLALYNDQMRLPGEPRYRTAAEMRAAYEQSLGY